jgi:O-antigen/teichoic acid export membrane protein
VSLFNRIYADFLRLKNSPELKKSIIYIAASTLGYGIVFIQNFSMAFFLSIDFFGKFSLILSLFSTLYVLFTFGLNAVVLRFFFDKKYGSDRKRFISHITAIWLVLGGILTVLFLLLGYQLIGIKQYLQLDYGSEFIPILLAAFFFSFTEIFPNFFVARDKAVHYAASLVLSRALIFILLHVAVFIFGESSFHISLMFFLSAIILFVAGVLTFQVFPIGKLKQEDLKEILLYAFPLMIYALGGIGYSHGYRVIISNWLSYKDLAIFSLASQIASVYYLGAASCITGLYPKAYKRLEESGGNQRSIRFYLRALLYVGLGLQISILPLSYLFLLYFKSGSFYPAFEILPILLIGQFIFFIYGYSYILCTFHKKTSILTYSMFAGVITSLLLAYLLLGHASLWAAALPIASGFLVQFTTSLLMIVRVAKKAI